MHFLSVINELRQMHQSFSHDLERLKVTGAPPSTIRHYYRRLRALDYAITAVVVVHKRDEG